MRRAIPSNEPEHFWGDADNDGASDGGWRWLVYCEQSDLININRPHKSRSVPEASVGSCRHACFHAAPSVELDVAALPFTSTGFALVVSNYEPDGVLQLCFSLYTCSRRVMSPHTDSDLNLNPARTFTLKYFFKFDKMFLLSTNVLTFLIEMHIPILTLWHVQEHTHTQNLLPSVLHPL